MRTFEYRLYPNRAQRQQLLACLREARTLYNEMLAALRTQYEADGTFPSKYDLTAQFKGRGGEHVPATTVQMLADRPSKALKRYLQLKDLGLPAGLAPSCGLVEDRDVNTARNILRAGAPPSGTGAAGLPVELRSPRL
jgi:transposase